VLFCFLLNVTNLLGDLLEAVLVVGVLKLQLWIAVLVNTLGHHARAQPGDEKRTLFIQTHYVSATKFKISHEDKELLYHEGQKAARKFYHTLLPDIGSEISPRKASLYGTPTGRLVVQLKEAKELKKRHIICNLFCQLTVGKTAKKSSTRFRSTNPVWNENFVFPVTDNDAELKLEVFDSDVRSPRLMGSASVMLSNLSDKPVEMWQNIGKGKVLMQVTLSTF